MKSGRGYGEAETVTGPAREAAWPEGADAARAFVRRIVAEAGDEEVPVGARTRVLAAIEAKQRRRPWLGWSAALAGAGAAAAAFLIFSHEARFEPVRYADAGQHVIDLHGAAKVVASKSSGATLDATLIEDDGKGIAFDVARGSVLASVEHRPAGAPFLVKTRGATVKVVGTVLWVDVDAAGETTVLVGRGAVEVTPTGGGKPVLVKAGERWPARSKAVPTGEDVKALGEVALDGARFAAPAPEPKPEAAEPDCRDLPTPEALVCLERLAGSPDALRAETALYQIGWLQLRDAKDARAALAAWERQRSRFPSGTLRTEADESIIEALFRLDQNRRAREEIDAFLAQHPGDVSAPNVYFLSGQLARAAGNCARAVSDFDAALKNPDPAWAAEAKSARAACQKRPQAPTAPTR